MPSSTLKSLCQEIKEYQVEEGLLKQQLQTAIQKVQSAEKRKDSIAKAQVFLQTVAAKTQATVEERLSKLVTSALHTIYPENPYNFVIRFIKKRNTTECNLLFEKNGEEFNPLEESGGGPIDVASIALLVSFIMTEKKAPILFLDEPAKNLSRYRVGLMSKFLKSICEKLGLQIIIVTHIEELIKDADNAIEIVNGTVRGEE